MQSKQIKEWVKANKLLSAIIVGAIIIVIILYLGTQGQAPEVEQSAEETVGVPEEAAVEPAEEAVAPETAAEEVPIEATEEPTETATEEVPAEEPTEPTQEAESESV